MMCSSWVFLRIIRVGEAFKSCQEFTLFINDTNYDKMKKLKILRRV